jgi:hypothetical protein
MHDGSKTKDGRQASPMRAMCTTFRWMGNAKGRFRAKDEREMRDRQRLDRENDG